MAVRLAAVETHKEAEENALLPVKQKQHPRSSGWHRVALAALATVSWMCVSTGLVVLNKYLLSNVGFSYPMALSGMGMAFSSVASFIACKVLRIVPTKSAVSPRFYLTRIMPIGLGMSLALLFGNLVYLQLSMSFIQMLKAFSPVVIMMALFIAGQETPTQQLMGAVFAIAAGTAVASYGEINLNPMGLACMAAAEVSEATKVVLTQVVLVGQDFHPVEGLMYFAPACCAWLLIGVSVAEWPDMQATHAWALVASKPFHFALAAVLGFAVNSLTYAVVILASSVTLKVASTIKGAIVVCVGMVFLHEVVTPLQLAGWSVSMCGFGWFNMIKSQQITAANTVGSPHHHHKVDSADGDQMMHASPRSPRYLIPAILT